MTQAGKIHIGVGGWIFEPWRGVFYPDDLKQKDELAYMASRLTAIEINSTYYGSQSRRRGPTGPRRSRRGLYLP